MGEIIPADVMLTALEVTRVASIYPDAAVHISRAILAERERCAGYHDDMAEQHEVAITDGSDNAHHVREARNHRRHATAIRTQSEN